MKTLTLICALASTFSGATAAAPAGYIETYTLADCAQASGVTGETESVLDVNACVEITEFMSFQAGLVSACAKGKTPMVTAYSGQQCDGTSVSAGPIAENTTPGACVDIVLEAPSGSVSVGGQSAKFTCA